MRRNFIRCLFLLMPGILLFGACTSAGGTVTPENGITPRPTRTAMPTQTPLPAIDVDPDDLENLSIHLWHAFGGASESALMQKVSRFNAVNEWGINIYLVPQGDALTLFEAVNTALVDGETPEMVAALPGQTLAWDDAGVIIDLHAYVNDPTWGMAAEAFADIPQVFREQDERDGQLLGMPAERAAAFLFYNLTWAEELGFSDPPRTSAAFREQACAANASFRVDASTADDGYGGWIIDANWMSLHPWLIAFGGGVMDDGVYTFESEANRSALEFLKTLRDDGCAWLTADPDNPYAMDPYPHYPQFARRSALFITGEMGEAETFSSALAREGSTDAWTMIPFPGTEGAAITAYGPSYTILQTSPERQLAAWVFIRWLLEPSNQADWVRTTGTFPLRLEVLDLLDDYTAAHPQWADAVDALDLAVTVPQEPSWSTIQHVLEDGTLSIFRLNLPISEIPAVLVGMDATAAELVGGE